MQILKKIIKKFFPNFVKNYSITKMLNRRKIEIHDLKVLNAIRKRQKEHPNPFTKFGKKYYSQTDEDGITLEIINRIGISKGFFAEFGCGNGTENNTLFLASLGWKGFWIGGEKLVIDIEKSHKLFFIKKWITKENMLQLFKEGLKKINQGNVNLISLDLDGNDLYFCEELLLNNIQPAVFIVEYNAKFPPPIKFTIDYNPDHIWENDDYMGASLSSFNELFNKYGYTLICCNAATGSNAFFVKNKFVNLFPEIPNEISKIYVEPNYFLPIQYGQHPISIKTINKILSDN